MKINGFRNGFLIRFFTSSPLMVALLISASCKKSPTEPAGNDPTPRTSVPAALVGEWQNGTVSSVNFYNPATGSWGAPSGTGMYFKFTPDGHFEKGFLLQSSLYGHTMSFFAYSKGTMTVIDETITIYPTFARIKSVDNMVQENNYQKDDDLTPDTMLWKKGVDEYGSETLWLRYPDSNPSAFHRPS